MAHELLIENGHAAMFYVDEEPWHGLGQRLNGPPTSAEAIRAARLNWTVAKVPLYVASHNRLHEVRDRFALVREDKLGSPDCDVFGIVGRDYRPLQNLEAFDFFDPIVKDGRASYETAGALGRGERVWIQARLPKDLDIAGDAVQRFLLLSNSHDGRSSVQIKLTPIRVVCNNTLTAALARGAATQVRHDRDISETLAEAKRLVRHIEHDYEQLAMLFSQMASTRLDRDDAIKYFVEVFPDPADARKFQQVRDRRRWAFQFYEKGRGNENPKTHDSLWAAYNGVTELIDHRKGRQPGPDFTLRRLHSVWFGAGAAVKARALRVARDWVNIASPS
jgi:phage/plasmid-like protein (TIGR03299 family)